MLPWIKEYSPIEHASSDDPPIYLIYSAPPAPGEQQKDPTHTANYGVKLQERCKEIGVECELVPGITSGIGVPAALGIPVTHRGLARGVTFVTGHSRDGAEPDWAATVQAAAGADGAKFEASVDVAAAQGEGK